MRIGVQGKGFEDGEELPLLVLEVGLHDRGNPGQVRLDRLGLYPSLDRGLQAVDELGDQDVVLFQRPQRRGQLGVGGGDGGEQFPVLALMVAGQCGAKSRDRTTATRAATRRQMVRLRRYPG